VAQLPMVFPVLALVYGLSAAWCLPWLLESDPRERGFYYPAAVFALAALPIAFGLFKARKWAFIAVFSHAGAFLVVVIGTAMRVKAHDQLLYAAGHVLMTAWPWVLPAARAPFFRAFVRQ